MPKPSIDMKKCTLCGTCVEICPMSVFKKEGDKIVIIAPDECIGCRACEAQCEQNAMTIED